jgi:hypothetical protein
MVGWTAQEFLDRCVHCGRGKSRRFILVSVVIKSEGMVWILRSRSIHLKRSINLVAFHLASLDDRIH